jgi:hypothetical protein
MRVTRGVRDGVEGDDAIERAVREPMHREVTMDEGRPRHVAAGQVDLPARDVDADDI